MERKNAIFWWGIESDKLFETNNLNIQQVVFILYSSHANFHGKTKSKPKRNSWIFFGVRVITTWDTERLLAPAGRYGQSKRNGGNDKLGGTAV